MLFPLERTCLLFPLHRLHDVEMQDPGSGDQAVVVAPVSRRLQGHLVRRAALLDQPPQNEWTDLAAACSLVDVVHVELEGVPAQDDVSVHAPQQTSKGLDDLSLRFITLHTDPRYRVALAEGDDVFESWLSCSQDLNR